MLHTNVFQRKVSGLKTNAVDMKTGLIPVLYYSWVQCLRQPLNLDEDSAISVD